MPRPPVFRDMGEDRAVLVHRVMGADLRRRIAQPVQRLGGRVHPRIVQHQHVRRAGRRGRSLWFGDGRWTIRMPKFRARQDLSGVSAVAGRRNTITATPATVSTDPRIICQVICSPRIQTPPMTPNTGTTSVKGMTWFTV